MAGAGYLALVVSESIPLAELGFFTAPQWPGNGKYIFVISTLKEFHWSGHFFVWPSRWGIMWEGGFCVVLIVSKTHCVFYLVLNIINISFNPPTDFLYGKISRWFQFYLNNITTDHFTWRSVYSICAWQLYRPVILQTHNSRRVKSLFQDERVQRYCEIYFDLFLGNFH